MTREPFTRLEAVAAPLLRDNIDTDQIIPSREIKAVGRDGLSDGLFAGWRYRRADGRETDPGFVLNQPRYKGAKIIIAGKNFGCGSSREHAVWALSEYGVRAVVAKSFGEIFFGNCIRNGVLPIKLGEDEVESLVRAETNLAASKAVIDLAAQTIEIGENAFAFEIAAYSKRLLLEGLDPIDLTLKDRAMIEGFEARDRPTRPWVYQFSN